MPAGSCGWRDALRWRLRGRRERAHRLKGSCGPVDTAAGDRRRSRRIGGKGAFVKVRRVVTSLGAALLALSVTVAVAPPGEAKPAAARPAKVKSKIADSLQDDAGVRAKRTGDDAAKRGRNGDLKVLVE